MAWSSTKGVEKASGRWVRELAWALVWVGKGGERQVGGCLLWESGCKMEDLESVCGGVSLRKKEGL